MDRRDFIAKAFKVGGLAALYGLGLSHREAQAWFSHSVAGQHKVPAGGGGYTCVGWPSSGCVPTGTPATESASTGVDRHYTRPYTATGNGTAVSIQLYITTWTAIAGWAVLYRQNEGSGDSVLIGYAELGTPTVDAWTEWNLTNVPGQNLLFDAADVLFFGMAYNNSVGTTGLGRNDTGGPGLYYITADISTSPELTVASWTTIADRAMAAILKFQ